MISIPSRHRSLALLASVLAAQVFLLAVQIRPDSRSKQRLIRVWAISLISPLERAGAWGVEHVRSPWNRYIALRGTRRENEQLHQEVDALKLRIQQLEGRAAEADRLSALLEFRRSHADTPMLAARVIGAAADPASQIIFIDRGTRDGLRRDMAVITPDGIVGKIIDVVRDTSQVLLITDKDSGVGAMLSDSRVQAPVSGTGEPLLVMKYVSNDDKVVPGARVVTSGMDRIFPADLPIGTVAEAKLGNPFQQIRVKPVAALDRLEAVIVLLSLHPLVAQTEAAPAPSLPQKQSKTSPAPAAASPLPERVSQEAPNR
jgi:rod shape-determining protein MreC